MHHTRIMIACAVLVALPIFASDETNRLSEGLIYSVDRVPERVFDTARDVEVITQEQIIRSNAQNLGQLLELQRGIGVANAESGTMPVIRGLGGKQVLILIDGVKVNNATWRGPLKEYLNIIDLSQVDRVEIVRGVVSVLGTESLGGVVNIITRKSAGQDGFGGTAGIRYASGEQATNPWLSVHGTSGSLRLEAGGTYINAGDMDAGGGAGRQVQSDYKQSAAHLNGQWLLSQEKTIGFGYQKGVVQDEPTAPSSNISRVSWQPAKLDLLHLSYQDLTSRRWEDSLSVTVYGNRQTDLRNVDFRAQPDIHEHDLDTLAGANLELGTFIGAHHHLVYGLDTTTERVRSGKLQYFADGSAQEVRGNLMDHSSYRMSSLYVQDRAEISRWLTVIGGVRLGRFELSGNENNSVGHFDIDAKRSNVTEALNLIGHVTPSLNVIGNVVKGYRAPNLDDVSHFSRRSTQEVPNPAAGPERVLSMEAGLKYDTARLSGAMFYFRNRFDALLVKAPAVYNGLPFADTNGNGRREPNEPFIFSNQNVGKATIDGFEGDGALTLPRGFLLSAGYSRLVGTDEVANQPLSSMPPASGMLSLQYTPPAARLPWGEVIVRFAEAQHRLSQADVLNTAIGPAGIDAYRVVDLRSGFTLGRAAVSVALENVFDEKYKFIGSVPYQPGRQLVLGTAWNF